VDLLGPRQGVYRAETGSLRSRAYVDPRFDRDHAARWGMSLAALERPLGTLVQDYRPDVLVIALGLNDLVLGLRSVPELVDLTAGLVAEARAVDPAVSVVLTRVAASWLPRADELNARLSALAGELGPGVVAAAADLGFRRSRDTYDGRHPSARGEVRIDPPGVDRDYVWVRDLTSGSGWHRRGGAWRGGVAVLDGFRAGHAYRFRLQPARGFHRSRDVRSNSLDLVPEPARVAR